MTSEEYLFSERSFPQSLRSLTSFIFFTCAGAFNLKLKLIRIDLRVNKTQKRRGVYWPPPKPGWPEPELPPYPAPGCPLPLPVASCPCRAR